MITIIGVGHIFDLKEKIKRIISERRPDVVCVELDEGRYRVMVDSDRGGRLPITYQLLANFQNRMAAKYESEPGSEMLAAIEAADEVGARAEFIDMDAATIWGNLRKSMPFREKVKLLFSGIAAMFTTKKTVEREIESFQDNEEVYMEILAQEYPSMKKALVDDRNNYMARRIREMTKFYRNILVFVGDAHVVGIKNLLHDCDVEIIRLKELRDIEISPPPAKGGEINISFTVDGHA